MVSPDQIDEVLTLFGDNDIEVVDASRPACVPRRRPPQRRETRTTVDQ
jgi:hypothetical protein